MILKEPYAGKGYIIPHYHVSKELYDYIRSLTNNIHHLLDETKDIEAQRNDCHYFISHIFASMDYEHTRNKDDPIEELTIPVYCRRIYWH